MTVWEIPTQALTAFAAPTSSFTEAGDYVRSLTSLRPHAVRKPSLAMWKGKWKRTKEPSQQPEVRPCIIGPSVLGHLR